jgi:hypothetical protein
VDRHKLVGLVAVAAVVVFVAVLAASGYGDDSPGGIRSSSAPVGAAPVYNEIASTSSCVRLQEMFDTADRNNNREEPGSYLFEVTLNYMTATNDRMDELGCFG